jgi:SAM-dependent methyltransferase
MLVAALQLIVDLSYKHLLRGKKVLHFAPEDGLIPLFKENAEHYVSADYLRTDCDLQVNMSDMPQVSRESFDAVIALDVLEHVPDYPRAIDEIYRILSTPGWAILTVPQKDHLPETYENAAFVTSCDRLKHFGQSDHLRIFGSDFPALVAMRGFAVREVDERDFDENTRNRNILVPPRLSQRPMATNFRKIFFCQKIPDRSGSDLLAEQRD